MLARLLAIAGYALIAAVFIALTVVSVRHYVEERIELGER